MLNITVIILNTKEHYVAHSRFGLIKQVSTFGVYIMTSFSSSQITPFAPDLKGDARLDWNKFNNNFLTLARQTCRELTGGTGLLGYIIDAADWNRFPPNILQGGAIQPVFDITTAIALPPANASNAVVKFWETAIKDRTAINEALQNLTQRMILSMPLSDVSELSDPTWGLISTTLQQMYLHCKAKYSILNATDFDTIFQRLNLPKSATEDYPALAERHRDLHAVCLNAGQALSELEKCRYYKTSLQNDPAGHTASQHYVQSTPLLSNQTFAQLVAHVALHAPNHVITTTSLGFATASAVSSIPQATPTRSSNITSAEAALTAQVSLLQRELSTLRRSQTSRSQPGHQVPPPSTTNRRNNVPNPRLYCHAHGYGHHLGTACKHMLANPTQFGPTHTSATDPFNPPGGSTKQ